MTALLRATWKESFAFFLSTDFHLYPLLMLNTIVRTIKNIFYYFFWLIPLALYAHTQLLQELLGLNLLPTDRIYSFTSISSAFVEILLCFAIVLIARSSLEPKGLSYFIYFSPRILVFGLFWMIPALPIIPIGIIASFFFLDGPFSLKNLYASVKNSFFMILYFFPLFFVAGIMILIGLNLIKLPCIFLLKLSMQNSLTPLFIVDFGFTLLNNIILSSTTSVLYIMLKHRHYSLFFAE